MKLRSRTLAILPFTLAIAASASALAQTPDAYVKSEHVKLEGLLKQPDSASKESQISTALDSMVDYDALTKRTFGEPCPTAGCTDHWAQLSDAQKTEMLGLIKQLVQKNYKKNLKKTLDYNITYSGAATTGSSFQVHTEAKSTINLRDPSVFVDYVLEGSNGGPYHVIDIVTERSSLTKNYYDSFHKYLTSPSQGYPYLKQKVVDKIAKL